MHIANHQLMLVGMGFTATAAHCCPDLRITNVYNWNGSSLMLASHAVAPCRHPRAFCREIDQLVREGGLRGECP
jgi:hypothetical protein